MIEFNEVTIGYSEPLAEITIKELESNSIYALIGSNGSGKSTFLKTICGRQKTVGGDIRINGKKISEMDRNELANTVAFVPSKFPETDFMTVFDFISLGRTPYLSSMGSLTNNDISIAEQVIRQVQINHLQTKYINQLSDGERQLCSVARALAQQTPVILLDEPTGFLDFRNKRRLLELLENLTQQLNLLILFSTHDIETIKQINLKLIGIEAKQPNDISVKKLEFIDSGMPFEEMIVRYYR